ncbi:MAG: alpha/beta fold hydrolase [Acidimicrobiales bacterium]
MILPVGGHRLEVEEWPASAPGRPPIVLLHEGLGCAARWRDLPGRLGEATGARVVAYSRYGHGASEVLEGGRPPSYMHDEATVALPALRSELGLDRPVLVGHSDGASIAVVHAGSGLWPVAGLVLLAPHVLVEDASLEGIAAARTAYLETDLRARLGRWHRDADATFWGWNDVWLSPEFRAWDIRGSLAGITCPVLVVQGTADPYGTLAQVEAVERGTPAPVERLVLPGAGHAPHEERPEATIPAIVEFYRHLTVRHADVE